jgi:hypothetical protein
LPLPAEAGFVEGRTHGWTGYHTSSFTEGALITAKKPADGIGENDPELTHSSDPA